MNLLRRVDLRCTTNGHNKTYVVSLLQEQRGDCNYLVQGEYGRIGGALTQVRKYYGPDGLVAGNQFRDLVEEKTHKGYRAVNQISTEVNFRPAPPPVQRPKTKKPPQPPKDTITFYDDAPRRITI